MLAGPLFIFNKLTLFVSCEEKPRWEDFLPLLELFYLLWTSNMSWMTSLSLFFLMHAVCSYWISFAAMATSHHHPSLYHAGDFQAPSKDWGLRQVRINIFYCFMHIIMSVHICYYNYDSL